MKIRHLISGLCGVLLLLEGTSCSHKSAMPISQSAAYTNFETTLMNTEGDGTLTLRVYGKGSTEADAIETAKKNAVRDVIFKGISLKSAGDGPIRPLINEVNARERYAEYFGPFFRDGGEYRKFVKEENTLPGSRMKSSGTSQLNIGVICTVDRDALRQQLIDDGLLDPKSYK